MGKSEKTRWDFTPGPTGDAYNASEDPLVSWGRSWTPTPLWHLRHLHRCTFDTQSGWSPAMSAPM